MLKAFSTSTKMIIGFLFFNTLYQIDLCILKNPCIPGIKPTDHGV